MKKKLKQFAEWFFGREPKGGAWNFKRADGTVVRAGRRTNIFVRMWHRGFPFFFAVLVLSSGCGFTQKGLHNSRIIDRVCTNKICWIIADKELVNLRCTDRKIAWKKCQDNPDHPHCKRKVLRWDDGTPRANSGRYARCCTVLRPRSYDPPRVYKTLRRYWIWMAEGEESCAPHELGHIEIFEEDGRVFIQEHHKRLHGFGLGREKKRL